ncbi:hypothetical protein CLIB1423_04S04148 [[Candida] railenensis]|uniref:CST complex subunit Stn1 N-terminal domain-containing protein n=1 Tax=[Candida] railenensis TaxID=45579 RepID=A0A9P0QMZ2_9ASCO|nr:hypothetical protein CLIB1423_04S04148 [[Candida] railenensis]
MSSIIDFGPGQNHIFKRVNNVSFYVPELFHCSPTFNRRIKLFINDVNQSSSIVDIYGALGYQIQKHNYLMINNYPIRQIAVHGRIVSCVSKDISRRNNPTLWKKTYGGSTTSEHDSAADSEKTIFIMRINDFSGRKSIIDCIVSESTYIASGMSYTSPRFQSLVVEVKGEIGVFYGTKEVCVEYLDIIGRSLDDEIEKWDEYLSERKSLLEPWVYEVPEIHSETIDILGSDDEDDVIVSNISLINVKSLDEIVCEFIHWILQNDRVKFQLIELYRDPLLNKLIENHCVHDPSRPTKAEVFHIIRHHIQVECGLILVTKAKNVYCSEVFGAAKYITGQLERVKNGEIQTLSVKKIISDIRELFNKGTANSDVEKSLKPIYINEIVRWNTRKESKHWEYDEADFGTWLFKDSV